MGLLQQASLVVTPNAYKASKLYSVIPTNGTGDLDVVRATSATRVNSAGLIEIPVTNLALQSDMLANVFWGKQFSSVTANTTISPSGIQDADTFTADGSNNQHYITPSTTGLSNVTYTMSIYAKKNTNNFIQMVGSGGTFGSNVFANFDLNNGTIGTIGSATTASIESVGNGWYRCIITGTSIAINPLLLIFMTTSATSVRAETNSLSTSVYLWGAQFEQGVTATEYIPTTTVVRTRFAGITQDGSSASNIPRLDYTNASCPSILVEPQRTNIALWSDMFANATWNKTASSVTANIATSPSGVQDADKLVEDTTNNQHRIDQTTTSTIGTNTFSIFAKKAERDFIWLRIGTSGAYFDLTNGTFSGVTGGVTASIQSYPNGWYRCVITLTSTVANEIIRINLATSVGGSTYLGNGTSGAFIWGAQLEAGSFVTSYIPTTASTVTRNFDTFRVSDISTKGFISNTNGTWFFELDNNIPYTRDGISTGFFIDSNINAYTNGFNIRNPGGANSRLILSKWYPLIGGNIVYTTTTDRVKMAIVWNGSTANVFCNGVKVVTNTAFVPTANMQYLSCINSVNVPMFIKSTLLFPTQLTDAQCISLTTL